MKGAFCSKHEVSWSHITTLSLVSPSTRNLLIDVKLLTTPHKDSNSYSLQYSPKPNNRNLQIQQGQLIQCPLHYSPNITMETSRCNRDSPHCLNPCMNTVAASIWNLEPFHPAHTLSRQGEVYKSMTAWSMLRMGPNVTSVQHWVQWVGVRALLSKGNLSQGSQRLSTQAGQLSEVIGRLSDHGWPS